MVSQDYSNFPLISSFCLKSVCYSSAIVSSKNVCNIYSEDGTLSKMCFTKSRLANEASRL